MLLGTPTFAQTIAITGGTVALGDGSEPIQGGTVLIRNGRIVAAGANVGIPQGAEMVDARGKWVTPGVIDAHSHLGVYAAPEVDAHSDGNEITDPVTANVWAEHSIWPQENSTGSSVR